MFLAGLLDWVGEKIPTFNSIAGAKLIEQGNAHIKTITENDELILGNRPLELDNIEPFICKAVGSGVVYFYKGYSLIEFTPNKPVDQYPNESTWGYEVIKILANKYLDKQELDSI